MAAFDFDSYINKRTSVGSSDKIAALVTASQEKVSALAKMSQRIEVEREASKDSFTSQLGMSPDSALGGLVNFGANVYSGLSRTTGDIVTTVPDAYTGLNELSRNEDEFNSYNKYVAGKASEMDMATLAERDSIKYFEAAKASRDVSRNIDQSFDRSGVVDQTSKNALAADLGDGFQAAWEQTKNGFKNTLKGVAASGLQDVAGGVGKLVGNVAEAVYNHPQGSLEYVAENLPQLAIGGIKKIGGKLLGASNAGYASDNYQKGIEKFQAENNGAYPDAPQRAEMGMAAVGTAALEQLVDVSMLKGITGSGKTAAEAARTGFKESLKNITKAGSAGTLNETLTEGGQTYLEGVASLKPASAEDIYVGGAIGGISGGAMTTGGRTLAELTGATPETAERKVKAFEEAKSLAEATKTNDTKPYLDPESRQYNPVKALQVLVGNTQLDETTPEAKGKNLEQARTVVTDLEQQQDAAQSAKDVAENIRKDPAKLVETQAKIDDYKAQLAALDPAATEEIAQFEAVIAYNEAAIAAAKDKTSFKLQVAKVDTLDRQVKEARDLQTSLHDMVRGNTDPKALAAHVAIANTPVDPKDTVAVEQSKKSIDTLINLSMASISNLSSDDATQLADNTAISLTDTQRTYLREFSKARIAENAVRKMNDVAAEIVLGSSKNRGIAQYRTSIGEALEANDQKSADYQLDLLSNFANSHQQKLAQVKAAFTKSEIAGDRQVIRTKEGQWITVDARSDLWVKKAKDLKANGGVWVHKNSGELVGRIEAESGALSQSLKEQQSAYVVKFNSKPAQSNSVAASTTPAIQTPAAPTSVASVVSADSTGSVGKTIESLFPDAKEMYKLMEDSSTSATKTSLANKKSEVESRDLQSRYETLRAKKNKTTAEELDLAGMSDELGLIRLKNNPRGELTSFKEDLSDEIAHLNSLDEDAADYVAGRMPVVQNLLAQLNEFEQRAKDSFNKTKRVADNTKAASEGVAEAPAAVVVEAASKKDVESNPSPSPVNNTSVITSELAARSSTSNERTEGTTPSTTASTEAAGTVAVESKAVDNKISAEAAQDTDGNQEVTKVDPKAGMLSIFSQYKDKVEGTVNEVFRSVNLVAQYLTQSGVNGTNKSNRPLVAIKNFMDSVMDKSARIVDFLDLGENGTLTSQEQTALKNHFTFVRKGIPVLERSLLALNWVSGQKVSKAAGTGNIDYKQQDAMQYLYTVVDGKTVLDQNVSHAMLAAAYSYLLDVSNSAALRTKKEVLKMHGRKDTVRMTADGYALLQRMQMLESVVINSLGKAAVKALGFTAKGKDTPIDLIPHLETAMGVHILEFLKAEGYVNIRTESAQTVEAAFVERPTPGKPPKVIAPGTTVMYVEVLYADDKGTQTEKMSTIKEANKGSSGIVDKLIGMDAPGRQAIMSPVKVIQKKAKKTDRNIAKLQEKVNQAEQNTPHNAVAEMFNVAIGMGAQGILDVAGFKEVDPDNTTHHKSERKAIEAQNQNLTKQWNDAMELHGIQADGLFYVIKSVWKTFRVGFTQSLLNQQESKIHRALFARPSWKVNIKFNNQPMVNEFLISVAMALGTKTDQKRNVNTLNDVFSVVDGMSIFNDEKIMQAAEIIRQDMLLADGDRKQWPAADIKLVTSVAAEGMMSLQALTAYAAYLNAHFEKRADSFDFTLLTGADGKTNGPMLTLFALGAAGFTTLNKGGFYSIKEGQPKHFSEFFEDPEAMDLYQDLGSDVLADAATKAVDENTQEGQATLEHYTLETEGKEHIKKATKLAKPFTLTELAAFQVIAGQLRKGNKVTSAMRNLVKKPLTAMFFGSSIGSAVFSMEDEFIDNFYVTLGAIKRGERGGDRNMGEVTKEFLTATNVLLAKNTSANHQFNVNTHIDDLLELDLTRPQEAALRAAFNTIMGNSVHTSMERNYALLLSRRDSIVKTTQAAHDVYMAVYNFERGLLIDALKKAGKFPTRIEKSKVNGDKTVDMRDLTKDQEKTLRLKVIDMLPVMHNAMSKEQDDLNAGLYLGDTTNAKSEKSTYSNSINIANGDNKSAQSENRVQTGPGLSGASKPIHSMDSANMTMAQADNIIEPTEEGGLPTLGVLSMHDEAATGVDMMAKVAEDINKSTMVNLLNYSPTREAAEMLQRLIAGMAIRAAKGDVSPGAIQGMFQAWADTHNQYLYKPQDRISWKDAAVIITSGAFETAYKADKQRLTLASKTAYVDQYTWEGGQYEVPQSLRDEATKRLGKLVNDVPVKLQDDIDLLLSIAQGTTVIASLKDNTDFDANNEVVVEEDTTLTSTAELKVPGVMAYVAVEALKEEIPEVAKAVAEGTPVIEAINQQPAEIRAEAIQAIATLKLPATMTAWGEVGQPEVESDPEMLALFKDSDTITGQTVIKALYAKYSTGKQTSMTKFNMKLLKILNKTTPAGLKIQMIKPDTPMDSVMDPKVDNSRGRYVVQGDQQAIYVMSPDFVFSGMTAEMLTHELLHASLAYVIEDVLKGGGSKEAKQLVKELEALRTLALAYAKQQGETSKYAPMLKNVHELVSWGMTNRDFQTNVLNKINMDSKTKGNPLVTGMRAFIDSITGFFFKTPSANDTNGMSLLLSNVSGLFAEAATVNPSKPMYINNAMAGPVNQTYSTEEIFDALDKGDIGTEFSTHMKGVLTNIVEKLHGPFSTFKDFIAQSTPKSAIDLYALALTTGVAPFASSIVASGFQIKDQEVYVAELVETVVSHTMTGNDGNTAAVRRELEKLFRETKERLKNSTLDKPLYDFVFNNVEVDANGKSDYLARFAALGLAHEGFNALLKVRTKKVKDQVRDNSLFGRLNYIFKTILELLNGHMTHTRPGQMADAKLEALVRQMVMVENKKQAMLNDPKTGLMAFADEKVRNMRDGAKSHASTLLNSSMFINNKNVFISAASHAVDVFASPGRVRIVLANIAKIRNKGNQDQYGVRMGLLNEMNGNRPAIQGIFREGKHLEAQRKEVITYTNQAVLESFVDNGTKLTDNAKKSLTSVLLRTGAHVLLGQYDMNQLESLLSDPAALQKEIDTHEAKLTKFQPAHQAFFIKQSRALGYFMVHNVAKIPGLNKNASNIANMFGSPYSGQLTTAEAKEATDIIDTLSTLHALLHTRPDHKTELVTLLKGENARTDKANGVEMVLMMHKQFEQESKDKLFSESAALMSKGYVSEVYNPNTDVKTADDIEGKDLEALGYKKGARVGKDPMDPNANVKHIYVLRDGGMLPWLSGMFSFTGMRAKGSKHHGDNAFKEQKELTAAYQPGILKQHQADPGFDPSQVKQSYMVPLLNANGQTVNYQYLMHNSTKDVLLERDSRFDVVMGVLAGSIYDKETASDHNRKAVQGLYDEFKETYAKDHNAFLTVGENSPDPQLREIYSMLPKATKDAIREIWGKDEMRINAATIDIAFGYRKLSLSTAFDKAKDEQNMMEQAFTWFVTHSLESYARVKLGKTKAEAEQYAKSAAVKVRRAENVWQALVFEVKDIFVVKSGITMLGNLGSNMTLLYLHGVPLLDIWKYTRIAWVGTEDHARDSAALFRLQSQIDTGYITGDVTEIKNEIKRLEDSIARNPVTKLIDGGLKPTIVEDMSAEENQFAYKTQFIRWSEKYTDKLNPNVRDFAKGVYMAHDTKVYKTLSHITQLSDFVARYALYEHLTSRKDEPMTHEKAIQEASDSFINYDVPMHRKVQWMDDMGFMMFTKYFLRVQRVIRGRIRHAPGKVLSLVSMQGYFDSLPSVIDASIFLRAGNNPLTTGALGLPWAFDDLATVKAGMSLFK